MINAAICDSGSSHDRKLALSFGLIFPEFQDPKRQLGMNNLRDRALATKSTYEKVAYSQNPLECEWELLHWMRVVEDLIPYRITLLEEQREESGLFILREFFEALSLSLKVSAGMKKRF